MDLAARSGVLPSCLALRPTVVATVIEHGAVLLDLDSKYFYSLNESAWALVQCCEAGAASIDAMTQCAAAWGGSEDEVHAFVGELQTFDLIDEAPAPSSTVPEISFDTLWTVPKIERHADPLQTIVTSAFDPSIPLAE
ncbi:MAG TPA: PqqD family protein [Candidatus Baltobacteraceae bacterium]|nr:PqqD family protein [Candidatus Baltobacteraceae bacterium]